MSDEDGVTGAASATPCRPAVDDAPMALPLVGWYCIRGRTMSIGSMDGPVHGQITVSGRCDGDAVTAEPRLNALGRRSRGLLGELQWRGILRAIGLRH